MAGRLAYLCLQATTEGQASYAHVHEIISGLSSAGWDVELYEPGYAGAAAPGIIGRLAEFARVQRRLARTLRRGEVDVLYIRGHQLAWPVARAARRIGVPVIQEVNGPYADFYSVWPAARVAAPLLDRLARAQYRCADAVIAVTSQLAAWVERETGRSADVIGNGANEAVFHPDAAATRPNTLPLRYAVFFGALSPWQGIELMLAAAAHPLWPAGISLVVAGDGVLMPSVCTAADEGRVVSLGTVPYAELAGVVAGSLGSLVLSSRPDDVAGLSPLKMYESMACGVPIVVLDRPGTADTVREHDCGIIADDDPASVAAAVSELAGDPAGARAMGRRGRLAAETLYSWTARAAATAQVVSRVAERRRSER